MADAARDVAKNNFAAALLARVEDFCTTRGLFAPNDGVLVACSGGVDSVVLADMLCRMQIKRGIKVAIAHFEHGIRGEESKADAEFVRAFAKERDLPFYLAEEDVPAFSREQHLSLETAARKLRYDFLRRTAKEGGFCHIATAHHADDQAETVLMRILRGTGTDGLSGMSAKSGDIIRPLLFLNKSELMDYAAAVNLAYRTDATNFVADATRNKLRLELLPKLKVEFNPDIVSALNRLSEVAAAEKDYLAVVAEKEEPRIFEQPGENLVNLRRKNFAKLPVALQRVLLRRFFALCDCIADMEFTHLEAVRHLILKGHTGNFLDLPHKRRAVIRRNLMRIEVYEER